MISTDKTKIGQASIQGLNITPRKVRLVANLIKGMEANNALAQLQVLNKRSSRPLEKLLRSAITNAKAKGLDTSRLVIDTLTVDKGKMLKRGLARGRGHVSPIEKRQSHVSLIVREAETVQPSRFVIGEKPKSTKRKSGTETKKPKFDKKEEALKKEKKPNFVRKLFQRKSV